MLQITGNNTKYSIHTQKHIIMFIVTLIIQNPTAQQMVIKCMFPKICTNGKTQVR